MRVWPGWAPLVAVAAAAALVVKVVVALRTRGTIDIVYWEQFLAKVMQFGDVRVYANHDLFNHPPFMIHALRGLDALAAWSGLPFPLLLRLPAILADAGSVALVWRLRHGLTTAPTHPVIVLMLALAPAAMLISGYHGNTDPLMVFCIVLGVFLAERHASPWWVGASLGAAISIKVAALILLPAFVLCQSGIRARLLLPTAAALTFIALGSPFLFQDTALVAQRVFGYAGGATPWGLPLLLRLLPEPLVPSAAAAGAARLALAAAIALLALWMNRSARRPPLFLQCAATTSLFLFLTPGFGVQYLAWLVPAAAAGGGIAAALFHLASGSYLLQMYRLDYFGFPTVTGPSLLCWAAVGLLFAGCLRALRRVT